MVLPSCGLAAATLAATTHAQVFQRRAEIPDGSMDPFTVHEAASDRQSGLNTTATPDMMALTGIRRKEFSTLRPPASTPKTSPHGKLEH